MSEARKLEALLDCATPHHWRHHIVAALSAAYARGVEDAAMVAYDAAKDGERAYREDGDCSGYLWARSVAVRIAEDIRKLSEGKKS